MRERESESERGTTAEGRRKRHLPFLVVAGLALVAGLVVGINDNPPGLVLVYVASGSLILSFAHRWTRVRPFAVLVIASVAGFLLTAVTHNLLYALNEWLQRPAVWGAVLEALHAGFFLVAILLCPVGVLIGALGALWVGVLRRG